MVLIEKQILQKILILNLWLVWHMHMKQKMHCV